jgi:hypothetical protein
MELLVALVIAVPVAVTITRVVMGVAARANREPSAGSISA